MTIHKLQVMHLIDVQDKKIQKQLLNFYLFKQNTLIQIHAIYNQKHKLIRLSRSKFFWFHVEKQSILGGDTVEIFSKNDFYQNLQLFIYKFCLILSVFFINK